MSEKKIGTKKNDKNTVNINPIMLLNTLKIKDIDKQI